MIERHLTFMDRKVEMARVITDSDWQLLTERVHEVCGTSAAIREEARELRMDDYGARARARSRRLEMAAARRDTARRPT